MQAPLPENEEQRLLVLRSYEILYTGVEPAFDDLTGLAATLCDAPLAGVAFVDADRCWFKSSIGLAAQAVPRAGSLCSYTILKHRVTMVEDAAADARFSPDPLVMGADGVRFFAGAPLIANDGHRVGALCVFDRVPRRLQPRQLVALEQLARQIMGQLELRRETRAHQRSKLELQQTHKAQRHLLASLNQAEDRFQLFMENTDAIVWMKNQQGQYLYVNRPFAARLGLKPADCIGKTAEALFSEDAARHVRAKDLEAFATASPIRLVDEINLPDGSTKAYHSCRFTFQDDAGNRLLGGMASDITRLKRAEESRRELETQLHHAQKMEAIGTLAGGIAHDFNNILAAILGNVELAQLDAGDNVRVQQALQEISRAGKRAGDLVRQILTFSRKQDHKRIPLQLEDVVAEAIGLLRATLPSTIEIRTDFRTSRSLMILADTTRIHQIVMNLCTNAQHAMSERGGRILVSIEEVRLSNDLNNPSVELPEGDYLRLCIEDTGTGIPRGVLDRIFEPFFTTKPPGQGSGLGLAVVHGIVKDHDGAIHVASDEGRGTIFRLYFPALKQVHQEHHEKKTFPLGCREHVLLVDDEPALTRTCSLLLERFGYRVTSLTDSEAALARFKLSSNEFDILISDFTMPKLNGIDLAEQVHQIRPNLPIIIMTGYGAELTPASLLQYGITGLLHKPVNIESLSAAIRTALISTKIAAG